MASAISKIATIVKADDGEEVAAQVFGGTLPALPAIQDGTLETPEVDQQVVAQESVEPSQKRRKKNTYKREERDSPLLSDLIKVVEYALQLPPGVPKQHQARAKFPDILRSNVLSKWIQKYFKLKLWQMPSCVASKMRAVPNWYLDEQGLSHVPRKARDTVAGVPRKVAELVDRAQVQSTVGLTAASKRADPAQGRRILERTLEEAMCEYNKGAEKLIADINMENQKAWEDFKSATVAADTADGEPKPQISKGKIAREVQRLRSRVRKPPKSFKSWKATSLTFKRFNGFFKNRVCKTNTAGNFLSVDDPRMAHARHTIRNTVEQNSIPWGMVLSLV